MIPTNRRPRELRRTLERLEGQGAAPRFEVIVVVNAEDDPAASEAAARDARLDARVLHSARPGVSASRNLGWRAAGTDLVLFLGDDILASTSLLREHVEWHRRDPEDTVGVLGHVNWAREVGVTPFMRWLEQWMQFDYGGIEGIEAGPGRLYTSNVSLKRAMLERVDGFDEDFEFAFEDIDLGYRLALHGFRLLYNRAARAEHLHKVTLESAQERMGFNASGERLLVSKHPELPAMMRERMLRAVATPARGRLAPLVRFVPAGTPVLGRKVWRSAEQQWLARLAPAFLSTWGRETGDEASEPANARQDPG